MNLSQNRSANNAWKNNLASRSYSLIETTKNIQRASKPNGRSEELVCRARNLIEIIEGKKAFNIESGEVIQSSDRRSKPTWEVRTEQARAYVFNTIYFYQLNDKELGLNYYSRKDLENELSGILAVGNERVSHELEKRTANERKRKLKTTRGQLEYFKNRVSNYYIQNAQAQPNQDFLPQIPQYISDLSKILLGDAKNDTTGKIIWKWSERIESANRLISDLQSFTLEAYQTGRISEDQARIILDNYKEALQIGIEKNTKLNKKYNTAESKINIYSPLENVTGAFSKLEEMALAKKTSAMNDSEMNDDAAVSQQAVSPYIVKFKNLVQTTVETFSLSFNYIKKLASSAYSIF